MNSVIPAARASSMAYWINGRSTSVMISLGIDLVGRKKPGSKSGDRENCLGHALFHNISYHITARCAAA